MQLFYRITRELDPGIANFRNLRQEWFLLGAIGNLNGEPGSYTYQSLNSEFSRKTSKARALGLFLQLVSHLILTVALT